MICSIKGLQYLRYVDSEVCRFLCRYNVLRPNPEANFQQRQHWSTIMPDHSQREGGRSDRIVASSSVRVLFD